MITWLIEFQGMSAPYDRIDIPIIRSTLDPIRNDLSGLLTEFEGDEDDLTIAFSLDDERRVSIEFRGEVIATNRARDLVGEERAIGCRLS